MKDYLDDFICDTQCEEYYGHDSVEGDISYDDDWDEDDLPDYIDD